MTTPNSAASSNQRFRSRDENMQSQRDEEANSKSMSGEQSDTFSGEPSLKEGREGKRGSEKNAITTASKEGDGPEEESKKIRRSSVVSSTTTNSTGGKESLQELTTTWQRLLYKDRLLTILSVSGLLIGLPLGHVLKSNYPLCFWTPRRVMYVKFPAEIFTSILSCLRVPVTFSSIIAAIGSIDLHTCRFIGVRGITFIAATSVLAVATSCLIALCLGPNLTKHYNKCPRDICGKTCPSFFRHGALPDDERCNLPEDHWADAIRAFVPPNLVQMFIQTEKTLPDLASPDNRSAPRFSSCVEYFNSSTRPSFRKYGIEHQWQELTNMNGVFTVAVFMGVCSLMVGESSRPFLNIFISCSEVFLQMATWALWLSPIGISSHVAGNILDNHSLLNFSPPLVLLLMVNIAVLFLHSLVIMPLIYFIFTHKLPFRLYLNISPIIATAIGTSSSSGTLPLTIRGLEEIAHLDPRVVRFLIPIWSLLNSDGTLIFITNSVFFLYMRHNGFPTFSTILFIVIIVITTTPAANTGLPLTGTLVVPAILVTLGIDPQIASEVNPIVWVIDGFVTMSNVMGDCVGAAVINHCSKRQLRNLRLEEEKAQKEMELAEANEQWNQIQLMEANAAAATSRGTNNPPNDNSGT